MDNNLSSRQFHGTAAELQPGDLIHPNYLGSVGHNTENPEHSDFVWTTNRVRDADWYARHRAGAPTNASIGAGKGHVYEVEPTGLHGPAEEFKPSTSKEPARKSKTASIHLAPVKVVREISGKERTLASRRLAQPRII